MANKRNVNVVCVSGTPGVGKTTVCLKVKEKLGTDKFEFVNVGDLIKEKQLFSEWDDEMNCSIFDENRVEEEILKIAREIENIGKQGLLIDFHSVGFLSTRFVDKVFVLSAETNILYGRLEKRHYSVDKIQENVQAEIFKESKCEAQDRFGEDIVVEMPNNTESDSGQIVDLIVRFLQEPLLDARYPDSDSSNDDWDDSNESEFSDIS